VAKDGKGKRRSRESPDVPSAIVPGAIPSAPAWQRAVARLTGARACYGKPVEAHGHVVIPVATLRTVGVGGYGSGLSTDEEVPERAGAPSTGVGGGGLVDARPVGFIDIGPDGVRYQAIDVAPRARRAGTTAIAALGLVVATRLLGGPLRDRAASLRRRPSSGAPWPVRSLRR